MKKYYTYIIQSELDNSYYIGSTEDVKLRLARHNEGTTKYTSKKIPWKLVYFEVFATRSEAMSREAFLKKQRNRSFYQRLIDSWSGSSVG
jgi:putative endonuclease